MVFRRLDNRLLSINFSEWAENDARTQSLSGFKAAVFVRACLHAALISTTFRSILASIKLPARSPGLTA